MKHSPEFNDIIMSLDELVSACGQERQWVIELMEESIIEYDVQSANNSQAISWRLYAVRLA